MTYPLLPCLISLQVYTQSLCARACLYPSSLRLQSRLQIFAVSSSTGVFVQGSEALPCSLNPFRPLQKKFRELSNYFSNVGIKGGCKRASSDCKRNLYRNISTILDYVAHHSEINYVNSYFRVDNFS